MAKLGRLTGLSDINQQFVADMTAELSALIAEQQPKLPASAFIGPPFDASFFDAFRAASAKAERFPSVFPFEHLRTPIPFYICDLCAQLFRLWNDTLCLKRRFKVFFDEEDHLPLRSLPDEGGTIHRIRQTINEDQNYAYWYLEALERRIFAFLSGTSAESHDRVDLALRQLHLYFSATVSEMLERYRTHPNFATDKFRAFTANSLYPPRSRPE
jgi:hypothetical protein